jgi:MerR family transcriptional regulator, copper efflux regulator
MATPGPEAAALDLRADPLTFELGRRSTVRAVETLTIADAAARTGFPASTLRYYEQVGLIEPERTASGYRVYDDRALLRLTCISRAKALGLSLDEISELVGLWDGDRCEPVQDRLRAVLDAKIDECDRQARDAEALARQLRHVAAGLGGYTPAGPCDDDCGCLSPVEEAAPIACTLEVTDVPQRVREWREVRDEAVAREATATGVRLVFARGVDVGRLATLAAAEQDCCGFLRFDLALGADRVVLEIRGTEDARPVIDALAPA